MSALLGAILVAFVLYIVLLITQRFSSTGRLKSVKNKHVVVTGGSSGIGKCVAIIAARHGANVTIIARDVDKLEAAKNEIMHACKNQDTQRVGYLSLDIGASYENVEKALADLEGTMGPIYMLVNCAGTAICGKIEDTTIENLHHMMSVNFYGTYYCIKAVTQRMKAVREGVIVLTASQAGLLGIFGYSAYSSTKFALRGLAESVAMELHPYNVSVTMCMPPDTDTPGFAIEEQSKPLETKLISRAAVLVTPEEVAEQLFKDALAGQFFSTVGVTGFVSTMVCSGMSPVTSVTDLVLQMFLMGLMRMVSSFYLLYFQRIILNCMKMRDKNKKSE